MTIRASLKAVAPDGVVVSLSGTEYRLLEIFLQNPQRVLSRDELLERTQGRNAVPYDRSIDVQISRLRTRLRDNGREPQLIKTVQKHKRPSPFHPASHFPPLYNLPFQEVKQIATILLTLYFF